MNKRLAPQPVDTALARAVRRLIDRLPGASIGTRRNLEEDLAYSHKVERLAVAEATEAKRRAYECAGEMRHMARRFAKGNAIPFPPIDVLRCVNAENPLTGEPGHRITVSFRPLAVEYRVHRSDSHGKAKPELDNVLRHYLREATRELAQLNAEEVRAAMFDHLCMTLCIAPQDANGGRG